MVTKLDFNRFLMRQGAFKRFYKNKKAYSSEWEHKSKNYPSFWALYCGFLWPNSPEGAEYWHVIHELWFNYLDALETNKDN